MPDPKEKSLWFRELSDNQRRIFIDTLQMFEAFEEARKRASTLRGGMHWKTASGRQYLFRTRGSAGYGRSLGPRSPENEAILANYATAKKQALERQSSLKSQLTEQA